MALQRQFTVFCYFNNAVRPSVLKLKKLDKIKRPYLKTELELMTVMIVITMIMMMLME